MSIPGIWFAGSSDSMVAEPDSKDRMLDGARTRPVHRSLARRGYADLRRAYHLSKAIPGSIKLYSKLVKVRNAIFFGGAPGDDLLCTALIHEYAARGAGPTAMLTQHPSVFEGNPDLTTVIKVKAFEPDDDDLTLLRLARRPISTPHYTARDWLADRDSVPSEHIIAAMCRKASLQGTIKLRPYLYLAPEELESGRLNSRQVAIQTSGAGALLPMNNKEWFRDRFQLVVDAIKHDFYVIQIGMESDPPVQGAHDLRGKTTIREAAALLANSIVFVGLVGFLMHLARAIDCRSVIVYGGREKPWQSGYVSNINLTGDTACSPCWRWNTCDYDHDCMKIVSSESVVEGIYAQAHKHGFPLECESAHL